MCASDMAAGLDVAVAHAGSASLRHSAPPRKLMCPLLLATLLACTLGQAQPVETDARPWVLRHGDGSTPTRVYLRDRGGQAPEFRAEGRMRTTLGALAAVLMDTEHMPEWVYRTRSAQRLSGEGALQGVSRVVTAMPPPLSDREAFVAWHWSQDAVTRTVTLEGRADPTPRPPTEGLVRMPDFASRWVFALRADGDIDVRFEGHADLGGNLARWPLNAFVAAAVWQAPLYTLDALRERVGRAPYAGARVPFIDEPVR